MAKGKGFTDTEGKNRHKLNQMIATVKGQEISTVLDMDDITEDELVIIDDDTTVKEVRDNSLKVRHIKEIKETLTDKQLRFIDFYVRSRKRKDSAVRAGYSEKTASSMAQKLLRNPRVLAVIEYNEKQLAKKLGISQSALIHELSNIGFSNIMEYLDVETHEIDTYENDIHKKRIIHKKQVLVAKDLSQIPPELMRAVKSIKQTKYGVEIILYDKLPAIKEMAIMLGHRAPDEGPKTNILNVYTDETKPDQIEDKNDLISRVAKRLGDVSGK